MTTTGLEVTDEDDAFDRQRLEDEQAWDPPTSKVAATCAVVAKIGPVSSRAARRFDKATADSIRIALLERLALALDGDSVGAEYACVLYLRVWTNARMAALWSAILGAVL